MSLAEIAAKYHSDKCSFHGYGPYYEEIFRARGIHNIRKVLEIGVGYRGLMHPDYQDGASLYMWRDFFPEAHIYGIDNHTDLHISGDRISFWQCDQSKVEHLLRVRMLVGADIDLVVDDGSHEPEDQILSALAFVPLLSPQGVYVIEDVRDPVTVSSFLHYPHKVHNILKNDVPDDRLIVIRSPHV